MREFWTKYQSKILIPVLLLVLAIGVLLFLSFLLHRRKETNGSFFKKVAKKKPTTANIALMGILVGLASVFMILSFPIFPPAPYLKVEISGLILYMVLLWFGVKPAIIVALLTNFIHALIPTGTVQIIFLDEGVNFIATMAFMLPSIIILRNKTPKRLSVLLGTSIGLIFTIIFMVLYNAYFNLPIIYKMEMEFTKVLYIFGVFNLIKWGAVTILINLLWPKLYVLKQIKDNE